VRTLHEARLRHAAYYSTVLRTAQKFYDRGGKNIDRGLRRFDLEWGNIALGHAWAEKHAQENDVAVVLCSAYANLGATILMLRLHPQERVLWLQTALNAIQLSNYRDAEAACLCNLGAAYADLREMRRAVELHEQALAIDRQSGDRQGEASDLGNLGDESGEIELSVECHQQQLAIARKLGDRRTEGDALCNLGLILMYVGETQTALECHNQALAISRETGDRRGEGRTLGSMGLAHVDLDQIEIATEFFEQWRAIAHEIGDLQGEASAISNLGDVCYFVSESNRAIEYYQRALNILRQIGDRQGEGSVLFNESRERSPPLVPQYLAQLLHW
jgi:tetratricopeptide (TPR) repeat protein